LQLDAVLRRRAIENAKGTAEALSSILNLVAQIEGMPVGPDVRDDIDGALDSLEKAYSFSNSPHFALTYSADAITRASRAFFNPGMLGLLYFPPEHNLAVYMPLLAPITVPLIASVMREFVGYWKGRKAARANADLKVKTS
jgi:phosphatidylinositol glycan class S